MKTKVSEKTITHLFNCINACYEDIKSAKMIIENSSDQLIRKTMADHVENNKMFIRNNQELLARFCTEDENVP